MAVHCRWRRPRDPFSGGNGLHGPQASGILAGRADRIRAADLNGNPNHSIGRAAKAAKEDIVGLIVALERYLQRNHAADLVQWRSQLGTWLRRCAADTHVAPSWRNTKAQPHRPHLGASTRSEYVARLVSSWRGQLNRLRGCVTSQQLAIHTLASVVLTEKAERA